MLSSCPCVFVSMLKSSTTIAEWLPVIKLWTGLGILRLPVTLCMDVLAYKVMTPIVKLWPGSKCNDRESFIWGGGKKCLLHQLLCWGACVCACACCLVNYHVSVLSYRMHLLCHHWLSMFILLGCGIARTVYGCWLVLILYNLVLSADRVSMRSLARIWEKDSIFTYFYLWHLIPVLLLLSFSFS